MKTVEAFSRFPVVACYSSRKEHRRYTHTSSRMQSKKWAWFAVSFAYLLTFASALPSFLMDEIKNSEVKNNKVKRAESDRNFPEESIGKMTYFEPGKPTSAIKRGTGSKDAGELPIWTNGDQIFRDDNFNIDNVQPGLFDSANYAREDKTSNGYRYDLNNKDVMDESLGNSILKQDLYGAPYGQFRYYNDNRRKRDTGNKKQQRIKRNIELTPDEVLALLALYENNQRPLKESGNYKQPLAKYKDNKYDQFYDIVEDNDGDETWLNAPVYPHASIDRYPENYLYDQMIDYIQPPRRSYADSRKKRFEKQTNDPTRMLRYLNGPNENDFGTLFKVMNNQKGQKSDAVPVYHRLVL